MPRARTPDELLYAPLSPSAVARAECDVAGDAEARAEVEAGRAANVALARAVEPAAAPASLRERITGSAARGGKYGRFADRIARMFDLPLAEALDLLRRAEDPASYGPGPVPNTGWLFVKPGPRAAGEGTLAAIGRLLPGARVPDHAHGGEETTLVLEGGFVEDDGNEVWRGDELYKDGGSEHAFRVIGDEPCIAAVIVRRGLTFKSGIKV